MSSAYHSRGDYSAEEPQSLRRLKDGGVVIIWRPFSRLLPPPPPPSRLGIRPSYAALRVSPPPGPVTTRRCACALWLSTPHMSRVRAENAASFSLPTRLWTYQSRAGGGYFIFSTPLILILQAAFLMLGTVAPAASANDVKSPSLLNDAGHSAAHTHGFVLAEATCSSLKTQVRSRLK